MKAIIRIMKVIRIMFLRKYEEGTHVAIPYHNRIRKKMVIVLLRI